MKSLLTLLVCITILFASSQDLSVPFRAQPAQQSLRLTVDQIYPHPDKTEVFIISKGASPSTAAKSLTGKYYGDILNSTKQLTWLQGPENDALAIIDDFYWSNSLIITIEFDQPITDPNITFEGYFNCLNILDAFSTPEHPYYSIGRNYKSSCTFQTFALAKFDKLKTFSRLYLEMDVQTASERAEFQWYSGNYEEFNMFQLKIVPRTMGKTKNFVVENPKELFDSLCRKDSQYFCEIYFMLRHKMNSTLPSQIMIDMWAFDEGSIDVKVQQPEQFRFENLKDVVLFGEDNANKYQIQNFQQDTLVSVYQVDEAENSVDVIVKCRDSTISLLSVLEFSLPVSLHAHSFSQRHQCNRFQVKVVSQNKAAPIYIAFENKTNILHNHKWLAGNIEKSQDFYFQVNAMMTQQIELTIKTDLPLKDSDFWLKYQLEGATEAISINLNQYKAHTYSETVIRLVFNVDEIVPSQPRANLNFTLTILSRQYLTDYAILLSKKGYDGYLASNYRMEFPFEGEKFRYFYTKIPAGKFTTLRLTQEQPVNDNKGPEIIASFSNPYPNEKNYEFNSLSRTFALDLTKLEVKDVTGLTLYLRINFFRNDLTALRLNYYDCPPDSDPLCDGFGYFPIEDFSKSSKSTFDVNYRESKFIFEDGKPILPEILSFQFSFTYGAIGFVMQQDGGLQFETKNLGQKYANKNATITSNGDVATYVYTPQEVGGEIENYNEKKNISMIIYPPEKGNKEISYTIISAFSKYYTEEAISTEIPFKYSKSLFQFAREVYKVYVPKTQDIRYKFKIESEQEGLEARFFRSKEQASGDGEPLAVIERNNSFKIDPSKECGQGTDDGCYLYLVVMNRGVEFGYAAISCREEGIKESSKGENSKDDKNNDTQDQQGGKNSGKNDGNNHEKHHNEEDEDKGNTNHQTNHTNHGNSNNSSDKTKNTTKVEKPGKSRDEISEEDGSGSSFMVLGVVFVVLFLISFGSVLICHKIKRQNNPKKETGREQEFQELQVDSVVDE